MKKLDTVFSIIVSCLYFCFLIIMICSLIVSIVEDNRKIETSVYISEEQYFDLRFDRVKKSYEVSDEIKLALECETDWPVYIANYNKKGKIVSVARFYDGYIGGTKDDNN